MRDYNFYLDKVKEKNELKSDAAVNRIMGFKGSMASFLRNGKCHLSDENMIKLADLAGVDEEIALLDLNIMRAPAPVQKTYAGILQKLTQTTAAIAILAASAFTFAPSPANAAVSTAMSEQCILWKIIYIS